jgi:hypothetical protein
LACGDAHGKSNAAKAKALFGTDVSDTKYLLVPLLHGVSAPVVGSAVFFVYTLLKRALSPLALATSTLPPFHTPHTRTHKQTKNTLHALQAKSTEDDLVKALKRKKCLQFNDAVTLMEAFQKGTVRVF